MKVVDVFKTPWQLYFITNAVQVFFLASGFKVARVVNIKLSFTD